MAIRFNHPVEMARSCRGLIGAIALLASVGAMAQASADKRAVLDQLKNMAVEDLLEVEVALDDVFDIFDGLVQMNRVSVASGGAEQTTQRAPAVTSVITAQDIEAMGAAEIEQVLETIPGLHITRNAIGYNPNFSMRGIPGGTQTLVLINGVPINSLYSGGMDYVWGGLPVSNIARIEVIRGPGAAVYGADAFAGVINIITKTRKDIDGTEVGVRAGSFSSGNAWVLHGSKVGDWETAAMLEYQITDGSGGIIASDAQSNLDRIFGTRASLAPGELNLARNNLDARLDMSNGNWQARLGYEGRRDAGLGVSPSFTLDPYNQQDDNRYSAELIYHNPLLAENWDVTAELSYWNQDGNQGEVRLYPPGTLYPPGRNGKIFPHGVLIDGGIAESQTRASVSAFYFGFDKHMLRLGTGYFYGDIYKIEHQTNVNPLTGGALPAGQWLNLSDTPYAFLPEETRANWYVFAQDTFTIAQDWELTAGVRYDDYSDFGSTTNPRAALVWQTQPNLTTKFLYGRAFRAPSLVELYASNNPAAMGNPNLQPETIDSAEIAFSYHRSERMHLGLNLFRYQWKDGIVYAPLGQSEAGMSLLVAQNQAEQTGYGFELEARWKITPRLSLLANYAWQHAEDANGRSAANVPGYDAYARMDWLLMPDWYVDAQINWIGKRDRLANDPRPSLDGYATLDLTLRYKNIRDGRWNLALGVRNVFDEEVYEPSLGPDMTGMVSIPGDLPQTGRSVFGEARYRF